MAMHPKLKLTAIQIASEIRPKSPQKGNESSSKHHHFSGAFAISFRVRVNQKLQFFGNKKLGDQDDDYNMRIHQVTNSPKFGAFHY